MDERKITVAVCGDSFCSGSVDDLGLTGSGHRAHFSQMLEDQYGYQVLYFAHGGFSNTGILFQIYEAYRRGVDVVVYTTTWSNRLEIQTFQGHVSDVDVLKNFCYWDPHLESSNTDSVGNKTAPVLSVTPQNLDQNPFITVSEEQIKAVELHQKWLHVPVIHDILDQWLFEFWHDRLEKNGILPIFLRDEGIGKIAYDFSAANPTYDTPFHTDRATQQQIAHNIHRYIVDNLH